MAMLLWVGDVCFGGGLARHSRPSPAQPRKKHGAQILQPYPRILPRTHAASRIASTPSLAPLRAGGAARSPCSLACSPHTRAAIPPSLPPIAAAPPSPAVGRKVGGGAGRAEEVGDPWRGVLPPPLHPDQRPSSRSPQTPPGKPQSPSSPTPPPLQPKHPGGLDLLGSFQPSLDESGLALLGSRDQKWW
uniref:Uncharacterized protein n=1 Tax=Oryza glumipatula TaxID=40148 RepID=A0A0E0ATZ2_9ORYZ